jgi:TRAP-type uncharacterized transport system fused permease subunit
MATRKQRRRRKKERRHEYEYVYVDEEGREIPVEEAESEPKNGKAQAPAQRGTSSRRGARTVEPPSWRRTLRRAAIFAPLMLIVVYLLQGNDKDVRAAFVQTMFLLVLFVPFSYFMDSLMYRSFRKRSGAKGGGNNATRR